MPFTFGDEFFNKGDSTGVSCMIVKGDLPLTIRWALNGETIAANNVNDISVISLSPKTSVLNIAAVDQEHRGLVECIAENPAGTARYSSELRVNGAPELWVVDVLCFFFVFFVHIFQGILILN